MPPVQSLSDVVGHDDRGSGILPCGRSARSEQKLGSNGRALDGLEGVARYASFHMAGISTFDRGIWHRRSFALSLVALYFISKQRERLAAIALAASMIPGGLSMMEAVAQTAPYFSLADVARFLNPRLDAGGDAIFEGPLDDSSSLIFYLNRRIFLVNQKPEKETPMSEPSIEMFLNEAAVLEKCWHPHPEA